MDQRQFASTFRLWVSTWRFVPAVSARLGDIFFAQLQSVAEVPAQAVSNVRVRQAANIFIDFNGFPCMI